MTRSGFWQRVRNIRDWPAIALAYTLLGLGVFALFISGLFEIGAHLIRDLGIAAVVAGLLGVGYDKLLREKFLDDVSTRVEDIFRGPQFRKQGLENMYGSLTWGIIEEKFDDLIDKAPGLIARAENDQDKPKIRILQTWMSYRGDGLPGRIKRAAQADCKVEVLLLNPYSRQVTYRGDGLQKATDCEQFSPQDIKDEIRRDLFALERIRIDLARDNKAQNLEVRVYNAAPAFHLYDFNGDMIMGIYWRDCSSTGGPQFEIVDSTENVKTVSAVQRIDSHFNALWNDAAITIKADEVLKRIRRAAMARSSVVVATLSTFT
jgi:hypothetical protein